MYSVENDLARKVNATARFRLLQRCGKEECMLH